MTATAAKTPKIAPEAPTDGPGPVARLNAAPVTPLPKYTSAVRAAPNACSQAMPTM